MSLRVNHSKENTGSRIPPAAIGLSILIMKQVLPRLLLETTTFLSLTQNSRAILSFKCLEKKNNLYKVHCLKFIPSVSYLLK